VEYEGHPTGELLQQLGKSTKRLNVDPRSRTFRDEFSRERAASVEKLQGRRTELAALRKSADLLVYELYGINRADRSLVENSKKS
jgi:hypothetical protein